MGCRSSKLGALGHLATFVDDPAVGTNRWFSIPGQAGPAADWPLTAMIISQGDNADWLRDALCWHDCVSTTQKESAGRSSQSGNSQVSGPKTANIGITFVDHLSIGLCK